MGILPNNKWGRAMIHVKETIEDNDRVYLDVSGVLDQRAVPILRNVFKRHLDVGRQVTVNLEAVVHITREGREFIHAMGRKVSLANIPEFMRPHHGA